MSNTQIFVTNGHCWIAVFFHKSTQRIAKIQFFFRLKRQRIWPVHVFNFSNLWTHIDTMTNFNIHIDNIQCTIPSENNNSWRHLLVPPRISYPWVELVSTDFFLDRCFSKLCFDGLGPFHPFSTIQFNLIDLAEE